MGGTSSINLHNIAVVAELIQQHDLSKSISFEWYRNCIGSFKPHFFFHYFVFDYIKIYILPILLNVEGISRPDRTGGTSVINLHNIAVVIELIQQVLKASILTHVDIGVGTPYAAQVEEYNHALRGLGIHGLQVGVTEFWQGNQAIFMIVDLVRAGNDQGSNGFTSDAKHLNVLCSRQQQALVIVGDSRCSLPPPSYEGEERKSIDKRTRTLENYNKPSKRVFTWLVDHNRKVDVPLHRISDEFVKYKDVAIEEEVQVTADVEEEVKAGAGDWEKDAGAGDWNKEDDNKEKKKNHVA